MVLLSICLWCKADAYEDHYSRSNFLVFFGSNRVTLPDRIFLFHKSVEVMQPTLEITITTNGYKVGGRYGRELIPLVDGKIQNMNAEDDQYIVLYAADNIEIRRIQYSIKLLHDVGYSNVGLKNSE